MVWLALGLNPSLPGPSANTLTIMPMARLATCNGYIMLIFMLQISRWPNFFLYYHLSSCCYIIPYNSLANMVRLWAERFDTKSNVKLVGFRSQLQASYVSSHTEELWYNETVCLWMTIYIYIYYRDYPCLMILLL